MLLGQALAQIVDPSIGLSRNGGTGLVLIADPRTMQAGHLALGWSQSLERQVEGSGLPLNITIGISDRVEFFASSGGHSLSPYRIMTKTTLGLKAHLLSFRRTPISLKFTQTKSELRHIQLKKNLQSNKSTQVAMLTRYPLLNLQVNNHLGISHLEPDTNGSQHRLLIAGIGVSRPIVGQLQVFSEILLQAAKASKPMYQSSLGVRSFVFGNLQFEVSGVWVEDEYGNHKIFSAGITATTQKLKSFQVPASPFANNAFTYLLASLGFNNERPEDSNIPPEFYVSWQERNLPRPPSLDKFRSDTSEVRPEFYYDDADYLPEPPELETFGQETTRD